MVHVHLDRVATFQRFAECTWCDSFNERQRFGVGIEHGSVARESHPVAVAEVARAAREHWNDLPARDRGRLQELLTKSRGRPDRLTQSERDELIRLREKRKSELEAQMDEIKQSIERLQSKAEWATRIEGGRK